MLKAQEDRKHFGCWKEGSFFPLCVCVCLRSGVPDENSAAQLQFEEQLGRPQPPSIPNS